MSVKDVVFLVDNNSEDIEFRAINMIGHDVIYIPIEYIDCKEKEVIGILAENNKLIITV